MSIDVRRLGADDGEQRIEARGARTLAADL
jgi:hypothetical protein